MNTINAFAPRPGHTIPFSRLRMSGFCFILLITAANAADWWQFRGPDGTGSVADAQLPTEFAPDKNMAWKAEIPGRGVSSPVVVGDQVIVTSSAGARGERMIVASFDRATGESNWVRTFRATGRPYCHPTSANAAPSPCSDGKFIYAFYSSNDLTCLDLEGKLQWFRGLTYDSPQAANDVGMSSSPMVADGIVVVQVENQGDSFVMGMDASSGETRWKSPRPRQAAWSSPMIYKDEASEKALVLVQGRDGLAALDLATGEELWRTNETCNVIPTASIANGMIVAPLNGLTALIPSDSADGYDIVWESSKLGPGSASPVILGPNIYIMNRSGVLSAAELKTGNPLWQSRVGGDYWASPVAVGNYSYCFDADGVARVVDLRADGKVIHTVELGEPILSTPAIAGNALFVRGDKHLWKISNTK
jgi:outer membrane protein assembly factor BamB